MREQRKIFISELAQEVNRREATVRGWCTHGKLPEHLQPHRDTKVSWRYWTPKQVAGIKRWMVRKNMVPGAGLKNYKMPEDQVDVFLSQLRKSRPKRGNRA